MHSNGTLPLDVPFAARCGYSLKSHLHCQCNIMACTILQPPFCALQCTVQSRGVYRGVYTQFVYTPYVYWHNVVHGNAAPDSDTDSDSSNSDYKPNGYFVLCRKTFHTARSLIQIPILTANYRNGIGIGIRIGIQICECKKAIKVPDSRSNILFRPC